MLSRLAAARIATQRQVLTTLNHAGLAVDCGPDRWRRQPVVFGPQVPHRLDVPPLESALIECFDPIARELGGRAA